MTRPRGKNRGDVAITAWAGCRVDVRPVEHLAKRPRWLKTLWPHTPQGVFVVSPSTAPTHEYDAMVEATDLLVAASAVDASDLQALKGFVERWGLVGAAHPMCVQPVEDSQGFLLADDVAATQRALREVQQLAGWLAAIQGDQWSSPNLPSASHIKGDKRHALKVGFTVALNLALTSPGAGTILAPRLGLAGDDVLPPGEAVTWMTPGKQQQRAWFPIVRVPTVRDVLFLELWQRAIDRDAQLRRCRKCRNLYLVPVSKRNKIYCADACRFAAHEERRKAQRHKERRRKER